MGIFVEDGHPQPCYVRLHKTFDILLMLVGVLIILISILYLAVIDALKTFFTVLLIVGIVISGVSFLALFGSGYYEPNRSDRLICLQINFIFLLLAGALAFIAALFCFITPDMVNHIFRKNWESILTFLDTLPDSMQKFGEVLTNLLNKTDVIGTVLICLAFLFLADMSFSVLLMGVRVFIETLCQYGSVALVALGGIILAACIFLNNKYSGLVNTFHTVYVAALILGAFCIFFGSLGIVFSCACITSKLTCPLCLISLAYITLSVLCIGGIVLIYSMSDSIVTTATETVCDQCASHTDIAKAKNETTVRITEDCVPVANDFKLFFCNSSSLIDPCEVPEATEGETEEQTEARVNHCSCQVIHEDMSVSTFITLFDETLSLIISQLRLIVLIILVVLFLVIFGLVFAFFYYWYKARRENKLVVEMQKRRALFGLGEGEDDEDEDSILRNRAGGFADEAAAEHQAATELRQQQAALQRYQNRNREQQQMRAAIRASAEEAAYNRSAERRENSEFQAAIAASVQQAAAEGNYLSAYGMY